MERTLQPELLDSLAFDHPDAVHSRRDLRLANAVLGNHRWLARTLPALLHPGDLALEVGAGNGELASRLARRGVNIEAIDRCPRPPHWPALRAWHVADARAFSGYERYAVVFGNLVFHHFSDTELASLGENFRAAHVRAVVACEPRRRRLSQVLFRAIAPLFRASHVTLHDAHVSIAAGFRGDELPRALGLRADEWRIGCSVTAFGLYRMVAVRKSHPRRAGPPASIGLRAGGPRSQAARL